MKLVGIYQNLVGIRNRSLLLADQIAVFVTTMI